ncbi:aspartate/glutamate racemase family protein [Paracoccus versutus]|uniref:aspartate/glutamate racemase family protein n=1 Tax=Paracoccus versutus TaxID=34007 RepID=UPI001FB6CDC3|nr:aspartate/glutamate racemase family protein [Paracoccus versutus]MCJ1901697.1 aspartate/glutamate racemase family protein [Paracoccus versutus]
MRIWYQSFVDAEHGADYWRHLKAALMAVADPGTEIDIKGITPHDSYAHALVEFRCAREVICNAMRAETEGYDAFVIGHFQDAGLYECRSTVDIPVLGLGEATLLQACELGQRIGVVSFNRRYDPWFRHQIRKYGLESRVPQIPRMQFEPGQVTAALESDAVLETISAQFEREMRDAVDSGLDVLVPGGGIPMLAFSRLHAHSVAGAPVLNGIPIVLKRAELAVRLKRLTGLQVSRSGEFVRPPAEILKEFAENPKGL